MKLTSKPLALILMSILFGSIAFTTAMGWWATESSKSPALYTEGQAAGQYNPADIRGSYTFGEISTLFNIPLDDLKTAFLLPQDTDAAAFKVNLLETIYTGSEVEVGTGSIRLFVAWYSGLPYTPDEDSYLPLEALNILREKAALTPEQLSYLESHVINIKDAEIESEMNIAASVIPDPQVTESVQLDRTVNGSTTFQQILDWGVSQADIEQQLGESMPLPATVIKDYAITKGLEFSSIKGLLQELVNVGVP